jgi:hypothetical protein
MIDLLLPLPHRVQPYKIKIELQIVIFVVCHGSR